MLLTDFILSFPWGVVGKESLKDICQDTRIGPVGLLGNTKVGQKILERWVETVRPGIQNIRASGQKVGKKNGALKPFYFCLWGTP